MKACKKRLRPETSNQSTSGDKPDDMITLIVKLIQQCVNKKQKPADTLKEETKLLDEAGDA